MTAYEWGWFLLGASATSLVIGVATLVMAAIGDILHHGRHTRSLPKRAVRR